MNGNVAMGVKMFNVGQSWNHSDIVRESLIRRSCKVPKMTLLLKDHKEQKSDSLPSTRPVVSACVGTNGPLSELICELLEPVVNEATDSAEVISGEHLLNIVL